jgi:hypothetical protein
VRADLLLGADEDKSGEMKPGKKGENVVETLLRSQLTIAGARPPGISLSLNNWEKLVELMTEIKQAVSILEE